MCKKCGCGLTDPKDPSFGKGPQKDKKSTTKKSAAKKSKK